MYLRIFIHLTAAYLHYLTRDYMPRLYTMFYCILALFLHHPPFPPFLPRQATNKPPAESCPTCYGSYSLAHAVYLSGMFSHYRAAFFGFLFLSLKWFSSRVLCNFLFSFGLTFVSYVITVISSFLYICLLFSLLSYSHYPYLLLYR